MYEYWNDPYIIVAVNDSAVSLPVFGLRKAFGLPTVSCLLFVLGCEVIIGLSSGMFCSIIKF